MKMDRRGRREKRSKKCKATTTTRSMARDLRESLSTTCVQLSLNLVLSVSPYICTSVHTRRGSKRAPPNRHVRPALPVAGGHISLSDNHRHSSQHTWRTTVHVHTLLHTWNTLTRAATGSTLSPKSHSTTYKLCTSFHCTLCGQMPSLTWRLFPWRVKRLDATPTATTNTSLP